MLSVGLLVSIATEDEEDDDDAIVWAVLLNELPFAVGMGVDKLDDIIVLDDIILDVIMLDDVPSVIGVFVEVDWFTGAAICI